MYGRLSALALIVCQIGLSLSQGGWYNVIEHKYDFQVALKVGNEFKCSGLIVDGSTILTTAKCVHKLINIDSFLTTTKCVYKKRDIVVIAGSLNRNTGQDKYVRQVITHPEYDPTTMRNDIALLILKSPIDLGAPHISSVNFEIATPEDNKPVELRGWGYTNRGELYPSDMEVVTVHTVSNADCQRMWSRERMTIHPTQLCTHYSGDIPKGACTGDEGGPVVNEQNNKVIGIMSYFPEVCASQDFPDVHTRIQSYITWIYKMMDRFEA